MRRHKYLKHFCSTCRGMPINSTCRESVDTTADGFLHRKHVRQIEPDNFRKIGECVTSRRDVVAQVAPKTRKKESWDKPRSNWNPMEPTNARMKIGDAYFPTWRTERTPARTRNYQRSTFLRFRHRDASFGFMFLPLFVYSTFERNRPSFHLRKRTTRRMGSGGPEFWKRTSSPVYFYKGFCSRSPWICIVYFSTNPATQTELTEGSLRKLRKRNVRRKVSWNLNFSKKEGNERREKRTKFQSSLCAHAMEGFFTFATRGISDISYVTQLKIYIVKLKLLVDSAR